MVTPLTEVVFIVLSVSLTQINSDFFFHEPTKVQHIVKANLNRNSRRNTHIF